MDEVGYLQGSLALFEGITPGYKAAPAGPQFWLGWMYTGAVAAENLVSPPPDIASEPALLRAMACVDRALWSLYRDLSGMRGVRAVRVDPRGPGGGGGGLRLRVAARRHRDRPVRGRAGGGGAAGGRTFRHGPALRPGLVVRDPRRVGARDLEGGRRCLAGVFCGLAVGSRLEMVLLAPYAFGELWVGSDRTCRWRSGRRFVAAAAVTALVGLALAVDESDRQPPGGGGDSLVGPGPDPGDQRGGRVPLAQRHGPGPAPLGRRPAGRDLPEAILSACARGLCLLGDLDHSPRKGGGPLPGRAAGAGDGVRRGTAGGVHRGAMAGRGRRFCGGIARTDRGRNRPRHRRSPRDAAPRRDRLARRARAAGNDRLSRRSRATACVGRCPRRNPATPSGARSPRPRVGERN